MHARSASGWARERVLPQQTRTQTRTGERPEKGPARALALGRWLVQCLMLCLGAAGAASATQPGTGAAPAATPAGSQTYQKLMAQELVPGQSGRYAWVRAAESQSQGTDALYLRLALVDDWLLTLEGRPLLEARTIEAAIAHGREMHADELQRRARAVWPSLMKAQLLQPRWDMDGPGVALPTELEALGADIVPEGPGLWVQRGKDGRPRAMYLWLGVRNGMAEPVPLPAFSLRLGHAGQQPAAPPMQCYVPRYSTQQVVLPQGTGLYLCRTPEGALAAPPSGVSWLAQMGEWFSRGASLETELPESDHTMTRTGGLLGQVENPAVDAFIRSATPCQKVADCPPQAHSPEDAAKERAQARAAAAAQAAASRADTNRSHWLQRVAFLVGAAGALAIYSLVARHVGLLHASALLWVGLAIPCGLFLSSLWATNWADSWGGIVLLPLSFAAMGAPFLGTFLAATLYRMVYHPEARRPFMVMLVSVALLIVLGSVARWLF